MNFREFCKNKKDKELFKLAVSFFILSILLSTSLYLKRVNIGLEGDLSLLETVKTKIHRGYEISRQIDKIIIPVQKDREILIASFFDEVNVKFPEAKLELSMERIEGEERVLPFSIKGDGNFERILKLINFLGKLNYPACFIDSISLKEKENLLTFEIKGELRVIK